MLLTLYYVSIYLPLVDTYHSARPTYSAHRNAQMDALGDPTRRAILERLLNGPMAVGELSRDFPVSRPAISQHLKVLKQAHLVLDTPSGARRLYQVDPAGIEALRRYFDPFWTDALAAFKRAAEEPPSNE
jgi:DNA-binding transcriptional ArsR family regulator